MSPFHIHVFLWHYSCRAPFPVGVFKDEAVAQVKCEMVHAGLFKTLQECPASEHELQITSKGQCYADALQNLPLPVQKWEIP